MSLKVKQVLISVFSVAIVIVLGYVIYTEREHMVETHRVVVKPESAGCVRCHGYRDGQGGVGKNPGIVKQWEASVHAVQGIGCMECHGVPPAGSKNEILNTRYVVQTSWDKVAGLKIIELLKRGEKPVERDDL